MIKEYRANPMNFSSDYYVLPDCFSLQCNQYHVYLLNLTNFRFVLLQVVKVANVSLLALYKEKKERPRS